MKRNATAHWDGSFKEGKGHLSTDSTVLAETQYSFKTRFEDGVGTNPEELLAAAHAGCFTMAISAALSGAGTPPTKLDTKASVTLEAFVITGVHLSVVGTVPGIDAAKFAEVVKGAEQNCLVSKVLNIPITSDATLN